MSLAKPARGADVSALPLRPNVGCVLIGPPRKGRVTVFAGQRVDNPDDAWQMPQGGIDLGEIPAEAALRELEEETGAPARLVEPVGETAGWIDYELPTDLVPRLWGGRFRGQTQKWFAYRFLGNEADIRLDAHHQEFRSWAWMPPDELIERIVPFKRPVYEAVFAEFAHLLRA